MPCDGKNPNCQRRRELLSELKCLVSTMDRKKPCEWDEPACTPPTCCPADALDREPASYCIPAKACKSYELRGSMMYRCECIKRNGLQDRCMFIDCMGRPECMTKLYPVCYPGRAALLKLTDLGDTRVALEKFYCADQARESALAAYCRLVCPENSNGTPCCPPLFISPPTSMVPYGGSTQPSLNQHQPQYYNPPIHNQDQKFYDAPVQAQQQLYRPPIQRYQQEQQYSQCYQQPQQNYQQQQQQQYQQQQPISYSYPSSQTTPIPPIQQCSPCMLPTFTQC